MAYTAVPTAVTGSVVTAAYGNILRDNDAAFKAILDGSALGFGSAFAPTSTSNFTLSIISGDPYLTFDTGDVLAYNRTNNQWLFVSGGIGSLTIDGATGKLTGAGFYDSGEVAVTNGSAITVSHGLSARPRFVKIYKATASGTADSKTIPDSPAIATVSNTQIITSNNADGATRYCNLYAMQ
jgi:hypothetical protein